MRLWSLHCKYREPLSGKVWKEWKFFQKNLRLSCLSLPKTKKAEGLPLLDIGLGVWLCLPKTTLIIPQNLPFELKVMLCTQSRFTYYFILYWVRERYEHPHYILPKEGHPFRATHFFYKGIDLNTTICLGLIWTLRFYYKKCLHKKCLYNLCSKYV